MERRYHGRHQLLLNHVTTLLMLATVSICDGDKCGIPPDSNGLCAENMVTMEDGSCCACSKDSYITNKSCNPVEKECLDIKCLPCLRCGNLHREFKETCKPDKNAICGPCSAGYIENPDKTNRTCLKESHSTTSTSANTTAVTTPVPKPRGCNQSKGEIPKMWDGTCYLGKMLCQQTNCCVPVKACGPGYKHTLQEDCGSLCEPCLEGFFSNGEPYNHNCTRCQNCQNLNREVHSECSPTRNAVCGKCLPGYGMRYFENLSKFSEIQKAECTNCTADEGWCSDVKNPTTGGRESSVNWTLFVVIAVLVGILLAFAALMATR